MPTICLRRLRRSFNQVVSSRATDGAGHGAAMRSLIQIPNITTKNTPHCHEPISEKQIPRETECLQAIHEKQEQLLILPT